MIQEHIFSYLSALTNIGKLVLKTEAFAKNFKQLVLQDYKIALKIAYTKKGSSLSHSSSNLNKQTFSIYHKSPP